MQLDISGKTALVTGSSKGIGWAIAQTLHAEGCRVALNGRNEKDLRAATAQLAGAIGVVGDVTQSAEAHRIVAEVLGTFGRLDILICNVGSGRSVAPGQENADEWQRMFAVNLWSATNVVEAAREPLKNSGGSIVCISSICGVETVPGAPVAYSAAKAALNTWVRGIARPLGKEGVRINAIAPGNVLFEGSVWESKLNENAAAVQAMLFREVSLSRLGKPEEIADLAVFLCSPLAGFATGSIFALDGGQLRS